MKTCVLKFSYSHHLSYDSEGLGAFITTQSIQSTNNFANKQQTQILQWKCFG